MALSDAKNGCPQLKPIKAPKLSEGRIFKDWRSLHLLEACLKAEARLEGRHLCSYPQLKTYCKTEYCYFISCILGERCTFYLRFEAQEQENGAGWRCSHICMLHSCMSNAPPITAGLQEVLSFWVSSFSARGEFSNGKTETMLFLFSQSPKLKESLRFRSNVVCIRMEEM